MWTPNLVVHDGVWARFPLWDPSFPPLDQDRHPSHSIPEAEGNTCRCARPKSPVLVGNGVPTNPGPGLILCMDSAILDCYSVESMAGMCENVIKSADSHSVVLIIG